MEIRPILSAMWRNKTGAVLIAMQIAFTLAVVANSVFIIYQRWEKVNRPHGMDIENIIHVSNMVPSRDINIRQAMEADLRALRNIPGVIDATPSANVPLSGSGWGSGLYRNPDDDSTRASAAMFSVDDHAVNTFGINLIAGRDFNPDDVRWQIRRDNTSAPNIIISQAMADELFPDGNALNQTIYDDDGSALTIIGIMERMHGSWVSWDKLENTWLNPLVRAASNSTHYLIRVEPGLADQMMPVIEETLREVNPRRVLPLMRTMAEGAANSYRIDRTMIWVLLTVVGLLIVITAVGIIGLAAFSVSQRTRQIGTRRALGARRNQIMRYFLVENWLITSIGLALGMLLATGFNYWLVTSFELERMDWYYVPGGMALLWLLGLAAVFGPARRASQVSPAIATRTV
ncbi:MAG: ABC transporter permease [Wenzhouxiangellaceae bacterium]